MKKQKGQAMVETAFVLMIFIALAGLFIDVAPLAFDLFISKQMSARGARAASVYLADGTRTCQGDVIDAIGDTWLMNADWDIAIEGPCDNNPASTFPKGTPFTVKIAVDYRPLFTGGFGWPAKEISSVWAFEVETTDQAR